MPLHLVKIQWKLQVRVVPCHIKLEMDEPDCPRQLPNKSQKLRVEDYKSPLSSQKDGDLRILLQQKERLSIFVHSMSPRQESGVST